MDDLDELMSRVEGVAPDQVRPLMNALDPALLMLQTRVSTPEDGKALLDALPRKVRTKTGGIN